MPSWSNQQGDQYLHNMDSNGYRLTVTHNAGANAITANNDTGNALQVNGDSEFNAKVNVVGAKVIISHDAAAENALQTSNSNASGKALRAVGNVSR